MYMLLANTMETMLEPVRHSDTGSLRDTTREFHAKHEEKRQRMSMLKIEYEAALKEERDAHKRWTWKMIQYGQASCRQLTDLMLEKLPRELRDCIYDHLCVDDQTILVGPYHHHTHYAKRIDTEIDNAGINNVSHLAGGRVKEEHDDRPPSDMLMPTAHIFNPRYMGETIAREAQEFYYSYNTFSVCHVDNGILAFLDPETFKNDMEETMVNQTIADQMDHAVQVSMKPLNYVRNLQIRIKNEHYVAFRDQFPEALTPMEDYACERNFLRDIRKSLSIAKQVPEDRAKFDVEFVLMTHFTHFGPEDGQEDYCFEDRFNDSLRFLNLLQAIRNTVYTIKFGQENSIVKVTHSDENLLTFPRDLTPLWSLTKEQWEYEVTANEGRFNLEPQFYLAPSGIAVKRLEGGFPSHDTIPFLRERWGLSNPLVLSDRFDVSELMPIKEGKYWPVGNGGKLKGLRWK